MNKNTLFKYAEQSSIHVIQGEGHEYIMTRASVFAAGSTSLYLPSDGALFSVPRHLSSKGEP